MIKERLKLSFGCICYSIFMIPGAWRLTSNRAFEWLLPWCGYYGFDECNQCGKSYALKHDQDGNCL